MDSVSIIVKQAVDAMNSQGLDLGIEAFFLALDAANIKYLSINNELLSALVQFMDANVPDKETYFFDGEFLYFR